ETSSPRVSPRRGAATSGLARSGISVGADAPRPGAADAGSNRRRDRNGRSLDDRDVPLHLRRAQPRGLRLVPPALRGAEQLAAAHPLTVPGSGTRLVAAARPPRLGSSPQRGSALVPMFRRPA